MDADVKTETTGTTVADVMQHEVVTVPLDLTVRELSKLLLDHGISGAPVVDERGRSVGVVSATDVMRAASGRDTSAHGGGSSGGFYRDEERSGGPDGRFVRRIRGDDRLDHVLVEDVMTPATFSVRPSTSVERLAGILRDLRLHRALVVENGKLVGIVSSLDILDVLAGDPDGEGSSWDPGAEAAS